MRLLKRSSIGSDAPATTASTPGWDAMMMACAAAAAGAGAAAAARTTGRRRGFPVVMRALSKGRRSGASRPPVGPSERVAKPQADIGDAGIMAAEVGIRDVIE